MDGEDGADDAIDFDAAAMFLTMAREAHAAGDQTTCLSALKMVSVALQLNEGPVPRFHLKHLVKT
jgi:hypothetical protein